MQESNPTPKSFTTGSVRGEGHPDRRCATTAPGPALEGMCVFGWVGKGKEGVRGLRGFCQRLKHAAARLPCRLRPIGHITHKTSFARCVCVLYSAFPALYIYMLCVLCCLALFVYLTLLASFFLPSHLSFKTCIYTFTSRYNRLWFVGIGCRCNVLVMLI